MYEVFVTCGKKELQNMYFVAKNLKHKYFYKYAQEDIGKKHL